MIPHRMKTNGDWPMAGRRGVLALLGAGAGGLAAGPARAAASDRDALLAELVDERAIRRLFAGYVAAVMRRDGAAVQTFFTADAWIRNFTNVAGEATPGVAPLRASEIGAFVDRAYHPYHPGQWSHIVHADEVVRIEGDAARFDSQVLYLTTFTRDHDGAPLVIGDRWGGKRAGEAMVTNCARWEADLRRASAGWKIAELRIIVDIPYMASA
jgi:hypothetical protein